MNTADTEDTEQTDSDPDKAKTDQELETPAEAETPEQQPQEQEQEQEQEQSQEQEQAQPAEEADEPEPAEEAVESSEPELEAEPEPEGLPDFYPGDTVKVHVRVKEGNRERMQIFEGVVISKRGSRKNKTFTVRKISFGVGVERIFPEYSPIIAKLEIVSRGDVRRAKLYYLRDRVGKAAKVKQKREY